MKALVLAATALLAAATAIEQADAWMRGGGGFGGGWSRTAGGGFEHSGDYGGFEHSTAIGPNGVLRMKATPEATGTAAPPTVTAPLTRAPMAATITGPTQTAPAPGIPVPTAIIIISRRL
jgi:hypothetical protein